MFGIFPVLFFSGKEAPNIRKLRGQGSFGGVVWEGAFWRNFLCLRPLGDSGNFCLRHLWDLWMPHLKCLVFHCGRQKSDNISAIEMLHQMSVCVLVVALEAGADRPMVCQTHLKGGKRPPPPRFQPY